MSQSPGGTQGTRNTEPAASNDLPNIEGGLPAPEPMDADAGPQPSRSPSANTANTPGAHRNGTPSASAGNRGTPGTAGNARRMSNSQGGMAGATPLGGRSLPRARGEFGRPLRRPNVPAGSVLSNRTGATGTVDGQPEQDGELPPADNGVGGDTYIWGTNLSADRLRKEVQRFLKEFRPAGGEAAQQQPDDESLSKYQQIIKEAVESSEPTININTLDLRLGGHRQLYEWLVDYPVETLLVFDAVALEIAVLELNALPELSRDDAAAILKLNCRPYNLEAVKHIRDLDPIDIDKLVTIKGMVTRTSSIIPNLRAAAFECASCGHEVTVANESGKVADPVTCPGCTKKWSMVVQHNHGFYTDKQLVKMQESPNDIPEGETPQGVTLYCYDNIVDVCRPGDRVTITGLYRAAPMRPNPRQAALHALFRTYVDVVHVQRDESRRLFSQAAQQEQAEPTILSAPNTPASQSQGPAGSSQRNDVTQPTQGWSADDQFVPLENVTEEQRRKDEDDMLKLSKDPKLVERLIASLAPNIYEMEDIKKGVLCQLFGGVPKAYPGGRIRGELNVLLVGDPSVSKSQLLTYVHQLAPRGIYTSGKGSSAVGLTAYITKDPDTKEMVLESGALVLSDRGVCCIDEFDKMSDSARSMLHEAMEQQTVSVAKAGLISTLNARCSILACANPIGSRYSPQMTIAENINLPPTLLTRFDMIYLILDKFDAGRDRRLARHLVALFHPGANAPGATARRGEAQVVQPVPQDLLKRYVAYARARINPKLSDQAAEELVTRYQMLRRDGRDRKVVVATPRQLESFIRISESLARMRLDTEVTPADVQEAVRLWYGAMSGSASSPDGRPDLDNVITGASTEQRQLQRELPETLRAILAAGDECMAKEGALDPAERPPADKPAGMRLSHSLAVDELLREFNGKLAAEQKQGITKAMLVGGLRQLDDLVLYDETTNTVRPLGVGRPVAA